ncbi:hypothetical protein CSKR_104554 [Clonorchis sinensis]|uniref:Uncharacterized protein n=1 Tax=Clonorchis sinensis TaxID=79923 RepID=A0A3R7EM29_CLOSI|nr:hypothetical protein CSKR_104554 [Clonorchis sinensis]
MRPKASCWCVHQIGIWSNQCDVKWVNYISSACAHMVFNTSNTLGWSESGIHIIWKTCRIGHIYLHLAGSSDAFNSTDLFPPGGLSVFFLLYGLVLHDFTGLWDSPLKIVACFQSGWLNPDYVTKGGMEATCPSKPTQTISPQLAMGRFRLSCQVRLPDKRSNSTAERHVFLNSTGNKLRGNPSPLSNGGFQA